MKHIKKFNESIKEDQESEILDIVSDLMDDGKLTIIEDRNNETSISFMYELYKPNEPITDLGDYSELLNHKKELYSFYEELSVCIKRLNQYGYEWAIETEEDTTYLTTFYKDSNPTLRDAFGRLDHVFINAPLLKQVLKRDYKLDYLSHYYVEKDYRRNAYFNISVSGELNDTLWEKLSNDISSLTRNTYDNKQEKFVRNMSKSEYKQDDTKAFNIRVEIAD